MLQDFNQYEMSCKDNITIGDIEQSNNTQRTQQAIETAQLGHFISNLPKGLNTYLSRIFDNGIIPSSGQWQKIALARVLFRQPEVIILDEPTANLDHEYSHEVYNMIAQLNENKDKLVFIITHKKEFLSLSNKIIYMENNQIAGLGSHQQLMNDNENYSHLWI